ncbi:MAG: aldehyde dehydrogenase family protein, partial [Nitrospirota bacterium]|nr:aldehyde dehydrogenase family protein [Nitrospirota bacterium]
PMPGPDEALAWVNRQTFGLTGGLFSRSPSVIEKFRKGSRVGNLYINRGITGAIVDRQPFGGSKLSGLGHKAGGRHYLLQFAIERAVCENTARQGFAPDLNL